jgi:hypothetical protein
MDLTYDGVQYLCAGLQKVASGWLGESLQSKAIELAAHAVLFVYQDRVEQDFCEYAQQRGRPLPREQQLQYDRLMREREQLSQVSGFAAIVWKGVSLEMALRCVEEAVQQSPRDVQRQDVLGTAAKVLALLVGDVRMRSAFSVYLRQADASRPDKRTP